LLKTIDVEHWERRHHYHLFKDYLNPFFTICAEVDITRLLDFCHENRKPFFGTFLFVVMKVLNTIPEFRYRIRPEGVVLHEIVHPSYTVMTDEKLFRFVTTPFGEDRDDFIDRVSADINSSKTTVSLEDVEGIDDLIYISSLKWVTFTMVSHPFDNQRPDSFPRITWGKYHEINGSTWIPVSVMAHHALCDGEHAGSFYQQLQEELNRFA